MTTNTATDSTHRLGYWSAVLCSLFSIAYVLTQLLEWTGVLGSAGGAESMSTPFGLAVLLTPSLLLGASFLVLMVCVHRWAPPDRKVWSQAGLAFATTYTVLISLVYYVQLTFVAPRLASGNLERAEPFLFVPFDSFLYSVDLLGYSFMSVATLFAALAFTGEGIERIVRWFMIANGLLIPFLALQIYFHPLIWIAALWGITFPGSSISLALLFRRGRS